MRGFCHVAATLIRTFVFEAYTIPTDRWKRPCLSMISFIVTSSAMVRGSPIRRSLYHLLHKYPACHQWQFIRRVDKKYPIRVGFRARLKRATVVVFNFLKAIRSSIFRNINRCGLIMKYAVPWQGQYRFRGGRSSWAIRINTRWCCGRSIRRRILSSVVWPFRRDAADQEPGVVCQWTAAAFSAESETITRSRQGPAVG